MRRRSGFTLVEVLVSMALILFIMSILAAAFGAASQAVSDLKSAGDLAEKLRGATSVLKRDLEEDHFTDHKNGSNPRLSQLDLGTWLSTGIPPSQPYGFFRIFQAQADQPFYEGSDLDNIPSFHQTGASLHYTIALNGTRRSDFLSATVLGNSPLLSNTDPLLGPIDQRYQDSNNNEYNSQLAEVAVFLAPTGDQTDGTAGPAQPLFALFRRQFLVVPTGWPQTPVTVQDVAPPQGPQYLEMSTVPTAGEPGFSSPPANLTFNTMTDLAAPVRRFWMQRTALQAQGAYYPAANPARYAVMGEVNANFQSADLLMTDVLSFDVRVLLKGGSEFVDLFDPTITPFMNKNPAFNQSTGPMVFDTWSNKKDALTGVDYTNSTTGGALTSVPLFKSNGVSITIQAIQITLRVWDFKTKKTRQVTIVQQM
jgi:prepilin-type N-terminal cleavage/methylation domain-containing protein